VVLTGKPLVVPDTHDDPRLRFLEHVERQGLVSYLGLPVKSQGQLLGVLVLNSTAPRTYPQPEIDVLTLFADQAALAIASARLFESTRQALAEKTEAEEALRERSRELEAVRTISAEIVRELDLPGVLNLISRHAVALVGAMSGSIRLWNPERQLLVPEAATGSVRHAFGVPLGLGEGVAGTAAAQRRGLFVNDFRTSAYAIPPLLEGTSHTAVMATPLLYGERLVGVLGITREQTDPPFTERDLDVLSLFAPQAAIAIENARLYAASQAELAERTRVEAALQRFSLLADEARDIVLFVGKDGRILDANRAAVAAYGYAREHLLALTIYDLRALETQPLTAAQLAQAAAEGILFETVHRRRDGSTFPVEVSSRGTTLGGELVFLSVIRDITLRKQAEAALAQRTRHLEALRAVSEEITHDLDLTRLLRLLIARAADLVGAAAATLYLWEPTTGLVVPAAWHGLGDWQGTLRQAPGQGIAGTVAQTRQGLCVNDYRTSPYANPVTLQHTQLTASLGEPLLYREELIGAITVSHAGGRCFTGEDQELVRLFATQAAIAIENARLYDAAQRELAERKSTEAALAARTRQLDAIRAVGVEITQELDLKRVLTLIAQQAVALVGADADSLWIWDAASQTLRAEAWHGQGDWMAGRRLRLGEGIAGTVARQRAGMIDNTYPTSAYAQPVVLANSAITASLAEPLLFRDRFLGVLVLDRMAGRPPFQPADQTLLRLFAAHAAIAIENARLYDTALRQGAELEALLRAARSIMSGLDLETILDRILAEAAAMVGTAHVRVTLVDRAARLLRVARATDSLAAPGTEYPLESLSGLVVTSGEPVFSPQVATDPRAFFGSRYAASGIATYLGLPIKTRGEVIGILIIATTASREYTPDELAYLTSFADCAAIAIENARLFREEQQRREQLEAVRLVSTEVARELDLDRLLDLIIRRATELTGRLVGSVYLYEPTTDRLVPVAHQSSGMWIRQTPFPLGEGVGGVAARERRGLIVNDYRSFPHASPEVLAHTDITAAMAEPLLCQDRLLGVISLRETDPGKPFTEEDLGVLRLFAPQAAIAIENARLYAELTQSYQSLRLAQAELVRSEKLRGLGQMAAGIAHDLNNMLAAILGQVELLKLRGVPPDVRDGLTTLETAASDGAQVVRRLQDFARQRTASPLAPMDLAQAVQEALELTRPRWQDELQQRGKTIAIHTALGDLPPILGHAPEIREVLTNLIFNAVDAMPDGGRLTLAGAATSAGVTLTLTDTGVGMSEAVRQKVFEPFFTTKGVKGTGLGLAVVYSILERHGGRVAVASAPGQGTIVTLHFQAAAAGLAVPAAAPPLRPASRRLLLIDDETTVRTTMGTLLRAVGHEVTEAENGPDGLASLADRLVDLVITDLGMPGMTGWEVAQQVKAAQPHLPVILLTGWGQQAPPPASGQDCVDRVLGKPIRLEALQGAIAALTGPGESPHRTA
jgi:PAS domain S-box-containing protein